MATSTIKRPYIRSVYDKTYLQSHIVNNAISFNENTFASARVVNGICFVHIMGATLNVTGSTVQILDGLPDSIIPMRMYSIYSQASDKTLKYIAVDKDGSLSTTADGLFITTYNKAVGDPLGTISLSYPTR